MTDQTTMDTTARPREMSNEERVDRAKELRMEELRARVNTPEFMEKLVAIVDKYFQHDVTAA